ncbi:glycosyltransferase [bacterium]|nr:glycosyltransferase [bacterium]
MRFLILNTDYPAFLQHLYAEHPGLAKQGYDQQLQARNDSLFGVADFYSHNLRALGHEAWDIHVNNPPLQQSWAREHGCPSGATRSAADHARSWLQGVRRAAARTPLRRLKPALRSLLRRLAPPPAISFEILAAQIRHYRPDVLLNHDLGQIGGRFLTEMRPHYRLLVGQIASPVPERAHLRGYDLMLSSLPNLVGDFRQHGLRAELLRFAFEPRILERVPVGERPVPVSFVGSLSTDHRARAAWLEQLCRRVDLAVWGHGVTNTPPAAWVRRRYRGTAWGVDMYQVLARSQITLNYHSGVAATFANNMRLFEATGMGALLVTDWKQNLPELFVSGREVVAYRSADECAELVAHYLARPGERDALARAGQERTLHEHTYLRRMAELANLVRRAQPAGVPAAQRPKTGGGTDPVRITP